MRAETSTTRRGGLSDAMFWIRSGARPFPSESAALVGMLAQKAVHRPDNGHPLRARAAVIIARVRPINRGRQLSGTIRALLALVLDQREDLLFDLS